MSYGSSPPTLLGADPLPAAAEEPESELWRSNSTGIPSGSARCRFTRSSPMEFHFGENRPRSLVVRRGFHRGRSWTYSDHEGSQRERFPGCPASRLRRACRRWLVLLLVVSYGLRVWLACLGGQKYWPDENRYDLSKIAAHSIREGHWRPAADALFGQSIHTLFPDFGLIPAFLEEWAGPHPAAVASYFGLFSVGAIFLIWAVARRSGAGETEALWAAYLAACANSLFYYSRQFFPYDISLCAMLAGIWWGLGAWSPRNSLRVGAIAGIGFFTYNGYWLLGACVLILHSLLGGGGWRSVLPRAARAGAGLALVILGVAGLNRALGFNLVGEDSQLGTIAQGDFPFGRRVIAGYLWYRRRRRAPGLAGGLGLCPWPARGATAGSAVSPCRWEVLSSCLGACFVFPSLCRSLRSRAAASAVWYPFFASWRPRGSAGFCGSGRDRPAGRGRSRCSCWRWLPGIFPSRSRPGMLRMNSIRPLAARTIAQRPSPGYQVYGLAFVQNLLRASGLISPFPQGRTWCGDPNLPAVSGVPVRGLGHAPPGRDQPVRDRHAPAWPRPPGWRLRRVGSAIPDPCA